MNSKNVSFCDFCLTAKSKYCCSRCHRKYCSMDCFKSVKHIQCSEEFFKQCVTEEVLSQRFDHSSKHKLLEILKRHNNQLMDDLMPSEDNEVVAEGSEETDQSFESRFKHLDLSDSTDLWNQLSDCEKQEFNQLLKSGKIAELIDVWNPWWKSSNHSLITPLDQSSSDEVLTQIPQLMSNINDLNDLISKPPSPSVCPAVVNCLLSYCYVCRLFNGEYETIDSIETFIANCPQISNNINSNDLNESLQMSVQQVMTEQPSSMAIELLNDVKCLIEGPKLKTKSQEVPEYALRALSDLICILNNVKKVCPKTKKKELKLELIGKKLEFYMSWSLAEGMALFECVPQIDLMIDTLKLSEKPNDLQEVNEDLRTKLRPKTLIEEIN